MIKWIATALALTFAMSAYAMMPVPVNHGHAGPLSLRPWQNSGRWGMRCENHHPPYAENRPPVPPMAWRRLRSVVLSSSTSS